MSNNTHDPVGLTITALAEHGCKPKQSGTGFQALCPAHDDKKASLRVDVGEQGVLLHCHATCETQAVCEALGLTQEQLFFDYGAKRTSVSGVIDTYLYDDEHGTVLFRVEKKLGKQFMQSHPDPHAKGGWAYNMTNVRRVPYRLRRVVAAIQDGHPVFVVEGEKDVHTLEGLGLTATTSPGGAGKWRNEFGPFFKQAHVVMLPDNDNPGRAHATSVIENIGDFAATVKLVELPGLPDKGDVTDWVTAGGTVDQLMELVHATEACAGNAPTVFSATELMSRDFADAMFAVPGIISEGCTLLVGAPKLGKSFFALNIGLAVASGGLALGNIEVEQGKVLYLALEDTPRRLKNRLGMMLGLQAPPEDLTFACEWPRLDRGGIEQVESWLMVNPEARMVMIDTLAKIKPTGDNRESMYSSDYAVIAGIKAVADRYGVPIVLVHHQRKAADDDPLKTVSGSMGLTGAADAIVLLTRRRGADEGHLYVTGRDLEEAKSLLSFESSTGTWQWLGEADEAEDTRTHERLFRLLASVDGTLGPTEVSQALGIAVGTAKWLLPKLAQEGQLVKLGRGQYTVDDATREKLKPKDGVGALTVNQPPLDGQNWGDLDEAIEQMLTDADGDADTEGGDTDGEADKKDKG